MTSTLYSVLILLAVGTLAFLPNSFAQGTDPEYKVRVIYFLPNDRTAQSDIDEQLDTMIKEAKELYAVQMNNHGFGRKTFELETDSDGDVVVHHVTGDHNDTYYHDSTGLHACWDEIEAEFDVTKNVYIIALDISVGSIDLGHRTTCGIGGINRGTTSIGGDALVTVHSTHCFDTENCCVS